MWLFYLCLFQNKPVCLFGNSWTEIICWRLNLYPTTHFDYVIGKKETTARVISEPRKLQVYLSFVRAIYFCWSNLSILLLKETAKCNAAQLSFLRSYLVFYFFFCHVVKSGPKPPPRPTLAGLRITPCFMFIREELLNRWPTENSVTVLLFI